MNSKLFPMLIGMLVAMLFGYFSFPLLQFRQAPVIIADAPVPTTDQNDALDDYVAPEGIVIDYTGSADSEEFGSDEEAEKALATWGTEEDTSSESDDIGVSEDFDINSFEPDDTVVQEIASVEEIKEIPLDPAQDRVSAPIKGPRRVETKTKTRTLANIIARERAPRAKKLPEVFTTADWQNPAQIQNMLSDRMLTKLGKLDRKDLWKFMQSPQNRRDLAVFQFINLATPEKLKELSRSFEGISTITTISNDLHWLQGLLYSGPTKNFPDAVHNIVSIFSGRNELINDPVARRLATTGALEFAREGWSRKLLVERFAFFYESYEAGKLNTTFDNLEYWETRFIMGCGQPDKWGSVKNLTWLRDNVRLPMEGYLGAAYQVPYRLRNVAGDSIHGSDYLIAFMKYYNGVIALAHREVGGVCGALSHYGTYAAIANGVPAATMGEPGHCAYTVRIGNEWSRGNSIYWQHSLHKTFWNEHSWDFLILAQRLYSDVEKTMVSDQFSTLGDFLASRRKQHAAFLSYEDGLLAQPNNWPLWLKYTAYLRDKAPKNKEKWAELHKLVNTGINEEFHNAAATLLTKYIYPNLAPLITDKYELTRLFASFFKECKTMGTNRWDVNGILSRQLTSFAEGEEQIRFMKAALSALIRNPDYAGSAIAWGLSFVAGLPDNEESAKLQDEFTDVIVASLKRTRSGKRNQDATWKTMNQAMRQAVENGDRKMFQAIAKLAKRKTKKYFPRNKFKFRGFPGTLLSDSGLIRGDRTMDDNEAVALHWATLQKDGGVMQMKSEITVELEQRGDLRGVVCISKNNEQNNSRPLSINISDDGQNWSADIPGKAQGQVVRFDLGRTPKSGRFIRLSRGGTLQASDFHGQAILGFYVYGKRARN